MSRPIKVVLWVIGIVVLILGALALWITLHHKSNPDARSAIIPHIEKIVFQTTSVTDEEAILRAKVLVRNNLPFTVHAKDFNYNISVNNISMVESHPKEELDLPPDSSIWTTINMTIKKDSYDSIVAYADKNKFDTVDYHFDVRAKLTSSIFSKNIHYDKVTTLPLFRLPISYIERTKLKKITMEKGKLNTHVDLYIKVINPNTFPIRVKDVSFILQYANEEIKKGIRTDTIRGDFPGKLFVAPKDTFALVSPEKLPLGKSVGLFLKMTTNPAKLFYRLDTKFKVDDPDSDVLSDADITIRRVGTLDALTEVPVPVKK